MLVRENPWGDCQAFDCETRSLSIDPGAERRRAIVRIISNDVEPKALHVFHRVRDVLAKKDWLLTRTSNQRGGANSSVELPLTLG
jgi:hypothetical protein